MKKFHATLAEAVAKLKKETIENATVVMRHGSISVEYFAPEKIDTQQPHKQDEIYVVISGSGIFFRNGARIKFAPQDVLFVPAGMVHRFEDFTDDFAAWVVMYGEETA